MLEPQSLQPAFRYSSRLYLKLNPKDISVLKFLLEANDNLAYLSTVSPHTALAKVVFAPEREPDVREFLETVRGLVTFSEMMMAEGNAVGVRIGNVVNQTCPKSGCMYKMKE